MHKKLLFITITLTFLTFWSCSDDDSSSPPEPEPEPKPNEPPVLESQTFDIKDDSKENESLAIIIAKDPEREELDYKIINLSQSPFRVDNKTGVLELKGNHKLDFWITKKYELDIQVSDGTSTVENKIIINVIDTSIPFITTWETKDINDPLVIPIAGIKQNIHYLIDWGDGTVTEEFGIFPRHFYKNTGIHEVKIKGRFSDIDMSDKFTNVDAIKRYRLKLISIEQWGNSKWNDLEDAFRECTNLNYNAKDAPDLTNIKSLENMFNGAGLIDGNLDNWNVSNVSNMASMFAYSSFNGQIGQWDVANVENMEYMFNRNENFNADISNWSVSNVKNMSNMFENATNFNQDLNKWNVENVESMFYMFALATKFNGDISSWNVTNVKNMKRMFLGARSFDKNLGNWNISNVDSLDDMIFSSNMSPENLTNTLIGWSQLEEIQKNVDFNLRSNVTGTIKYCEKALPAIRILEGKGWFINSTLATEGCSN